jgi:hypothetical protein
MKIFEIVLIFIAAYLLMHVFFALTWAIYQLAVMLAFAAVIYLVYKALKV